MNTEEFSYKEILEFGSEKLNLMPGIYWKMCQDLAGQIIFCTQMTK